MTTSGPHRQDGGDPTAPPPVRRVHTHQPEPVVKPEPTEVVYEPHVRPKPPRKPPARTPTLGKLPSGFSTLRDFLLFIVGIAIIGNEVFVNGKPDATIIGFGVALTGAPLVFGADERKRK